MSLECRAFKSIHVDYDQCFSMEALKGHVKFLKKFLYLLIRTYASPN